MKSRKQTALYSVALISVLAIAIFAYIKQIAAGDQPKWDPEHHSLVTANGLEFSVNIRGEKTGTPVILLHGFPESAVMWEGFMEDLAGKGYYAIAPNQRGYSSGARPSEMEQYDLDYLVSDVLQIADQLGLTRFHVIGHDWGSVVGWQMAAKHANRVISYAAISVPHIDSFGKAYREDTEQYDSSEYMRLFNNPILPEFLLAKNDYEQLRTVWDQHPAQEIEHYLRIFKQEHALTTALNWYRANFDAFDVGLNLGPVHVPTTYIWGNNDIAIKRAGVAGTEKLVKADYTYIEMDAGHWIIQEKYDELTPHLLAHLAKYRNI